MRMRVAPQTDLDPCRRARPERWVLRRKLPISLRFLGMADGVADGIQNGDLSC